MMTLTLLAFSAVSGFIIISTAVSIFRVLMCIREERLGMQQ